MEELGGMTVDVMGEMVRTAEVKLLFDGKTLGEVLESVPGGRESLTGKIHAEQPVSPERALELGEVMKECVVWVAPTEPGRCGDGRNALGTLAGTPTTPRAGVIGGDLVATYIGLAKADLLSEPDESDDATPREALEGVAANLRSAGVVLGGHGDADHEPNLHGTKPTEETPDGTGCGGDDGAPNHSQKGNDFPEAVDAVAGVMDPEYSRSHLPATRETIAKHTKNWNPQDAVEITTSENSSHDRDDAIEVLDSPHDKGVHGHTEYAVAVVFGEPDARGYLPTIDRDEFTRRTGLQLFTVTPARFKQLAEAAVSGPNQVEDAKRVRSGITEYNAATTLNLCDGSQYVYGVYAA